MRYRFAGCEFDTQLRAIRRGAQQRTLRPKPFQVLIYLIEHCDRVVSKQEFADQLWPDQYISDSVIQNSILAVRRAVGDSGREQRIIQTLHGYGYRFVAAITAVVEAVEANDGNQVPQETQVSPIELNLPTRLPEEPAATEHQSELTPAATHITSSLGNL